MEKVKTGRSILNTVKKRSFEWGEKVVDRVHEVRLNEIDLVAVDIQYHHLYQQKFFSRAITGEKRAYRPLQMLMKNVLLIIMMSVNFLLAT